MFPTDFQPSDDYLVESLPRSRPSNPRAGLLSPSDNINHLAQSLHSPLSAASYHSPLLRSASEGESDLAHARPFQRPSRSMPLPDPSQYPDPYPFRPPHHHLVSALPGLSSADSSSASTRSSAYTSSGSGFVSGDYGHVHVVSGDDDGSLGVGMASGITSDAVVKLLASDASSSVPGRMPIDHSRWSESYSASVRSRSSSVGNSASNHSHEQGQPRLNQKPSYDMGWQAVDERDEMGMSEEETDDALGEAEDYDDEETEEERTSAVVIAEEGRGMIVQSDGIPIHQLEVLPGMSCQPQIDLYTLIFSLQALRIFLSGHLAHRMQCLHI